MDAPAFLKALKPEGWPDRVHVGKAVVRFPNGTESGSWYNRPVNDGDVTTEYIRADLMAELVEALGKIAEAKAVTNSTTNVQTIWALAEIALAALAKIKEPQHG